MSRKSMSKLLAVACMITVVYSHILLAAEPYPGYTMFGSGSKAYIYDMEGELRHTWSASGGSIQTTAYLLPDGSALFPLQNSSCPFRPQGAHPGGTIQKVSWDGEILWDFDFCDNSFTPSYDIEPLPNGNVLVIAGVSSNSSGPGKIFEVKQTGKNDGEVVWECNVNSLMSGVRGYMNCVSYNPDLDQIAINIQTPAKTVAVIDHGGSGDLLSKFNQGFSGRIHGGCWVIDKFLGTDIPIPDAQPDLMRVGNIVTVSNGNREVVEIDPVTSTKVKSIPYSFGSNQGGVQRLPNGNTLVTKGYSRSVEELDDDGNVVWSLSPSAQAQRAYRYGVHYPGVSELNPTGTVGKGSPVTQKSLRVVYNHLKGQANLLFTNNNGPATVRIFSPGGKEMFSQVTTHSTVIVNTSRFSGGLYIAQVEFSSGLSLRTRLCFVR